MNNAETSTRAEAKASVRIDADTISPTDLLNFFRQWICCAQPFDIMSHQTPHRTKRSRLIPYLVFLIAFGVATLSFRANGQIATFENFTEGSRGPSFVDPASGITFSSANYSFGPTSFLIEYGASPTLAPVLPGNVLTGGAYGPGPGFTLGSGFGFTFTLPTPSTRVEMDAVFSRINSVVNISFVAYNANNQPLFNLNYPLPTGAGLTVVHPIIESTTPMSKIVVTTTPFMAVGFDNIAVPEPSCLGLLMLGAAILVLRQR